MTRCCAASEISAPAEMARRFTYATVGTLALSSASRICTAASTRPPKVLISSTTAAAPAADASSRTRCTKGASPRSMIPSTGATYTIGAAPGFSWADGPLERKSANSRSGQRGMAIIGEGGSYAGRGRVKTRGLRLPPDLLYRLGIELLVDRIGDLEEV